MSLWSHVSRTVLGCFAVLRQLRSIRRSVSDSCVPFAGRVAGYATSRLRQRNTRRASRVPAPSTSVGAQRRRRTDRPIDLLSMSTSHRCCETLTGCAHRLQAGCAHLLMHAWSGATVSFRLHPARRRFQPPPSPVVVIS